MIALGSFALFLALGGVASYEDWTTRKIRNGLVLKGLLWAGFALAVLLASTTLGTHRRVFLGLGEFYLPWAFYPKVLAHAALSLAASLTLWRLEIWPAGDAKLYALFSLLVPLIDPNLPGFPFFMFLLILINIFVPAGLVFGAETLARLCLRAPELARVEWRKWLKAKAEMIAIRLAEAWPHRAGYAVLSINLFALFFGLQWAQARWLSGVREPLRSLACFAFMFAFWPKLAAALSRRAVGLAALAALLGWTCAGAALGWDIGGRLFAAVRMTLSFSMFLSIGRIVLYWIIERESRGALVVERLEAGTILSDETWQRLSSERELAARLGPRRVDGLTAEDADALRKWLSGKQASTYAVYRTIPFAVWIFLGALLTVSGTANVVAELARRLR